MAPLPMLGARNAWKAAENGRQLRRRGITVRKTIDGIIATACIEAFSTRSIARLHTMPSPTSRPSLLNRIARVLLCLVFVNALLGKFAGFAAVAERIAAKGLPLASLLLVAAMALMAVGSALVISGCKSRLGVALLLLFLVPTTLLFHCDIASATERIQLFKNLAIIGGLLLVADQPGRA